MKDPIDAKIFLGLGKKSAQNLADLKNLIFRLISVNDEKFFPYPQDRREDRVCVEINDGKVTKAIIR